MSIYNPNGWTVGYSRDGLASIGQLAMADVHAVTPGGTWVRCEETPMTYDEAAALAAEVNAGVVAAKAAENRCPHCKRPMV